VNRRSLVLSACLVLLLATHALANPVYVSPLPVILPALLIEVVVLVFLMAPLGFDVLPLFFHWIGLTILSWVLFALGCYALVHILERALPSVADPLLPVLCAGEIAIIHLEALALRFLSSRRSIRHRSAAPLSFGRALAFSFVINIASIVAGWVGAGLTTH
jgi:hypothetical protein